MELYIQGQMFQQDGALAHSTNTKFVKWKISTSIESNPKNL